MFDTELGLTADATSVGSPTLSGEQEKKVLANKSQSGMPPASVLSELHEQTLSKAAVAVTECTD